MVKGAHKLLAFSPPCVSMYNQYVIICTCILFETIKHYVMLCYVMLCYVMLCYVKMLHACMHILRRHMHRQAGANCTDAKLYFLDDFPIFFYPNGTWTHPLTSIFFFGLFLTLQSPLKWALYAFFFLAFPAHGDPLRLRLDAIAKSRCSNDGDFLLRGRIFLRDENDADSVLMTESWQVCSSVVQTWTGTDGVDVSGQLLVSLIIVLHYKVRP